MARLFHERAWCAVVLTAVLALFLTGCTANHYRRTADVAAGKIIAQKSVAVPNMEKNFTIESQAIEPLDDLPITGRVDESLGSESQSEVGCRLMTMEKALTVAVKQSREYQNQKELLYLTALNLTVARANYTPLFTTSGNTAVQNQPTDVNSVIEQLAGSQGALVQGNTAVVQQYNMTGRGEQAMQMLLASGARLATSFTVDFLRFINGDPRFAVQSSFAGSITQPLLRGAGYKVTMEYLTQAERNVLYALRNFAVYRKTFSVQVAQLYYNVLQARDAVRNGYRSYLNFKRDTERGRALAEEGRLAQADLGQLEQALLDAENRWVNAIRTYTQNLDQFKITIGLPSDAKVIMDEKELSSLRILDPHMNAMDAIKVALVARLDYLIVKDQKDDAARQVLVAANQLKPGLDLVVSGNIASSPGQNAPLALDTDRARWAAGLNVDLPWDRTSQRYAYRAALIARERAVRQLQLQEDQLKLQIYDDLRALDQAKRNYEISESGVKIAERRVEEQNLRAELGRATARDQVDAQNALVSSQNQLTQAMVSHTVARLQFWKDLGILYIKDNGRWEDVEHAKAQNN